MLNRLLAVAVLAAGLTACRNSCQQLCGEIRDFASSECGEEWDRAALRQCYADHRRSETSRDMRDACSTTIHDVQTEWTCDDIAVYFDNPPGGTDSGG